MKKLFFVFILLSYIIIAQKVFIASNANVKPFGDFFCLPKTMITFTFEIEEINFTPGLLQSQLAKFFPYILNKEIPMTYYAVKSYSYSIQALPDEKRCYYFKPGQRKEISIFTSNHLLLAINDTPVLISQPNIFFHQNFDSKIPETSLVYPILDNSQWSTDTIKEKTYVDSTIIENIKVITKLTEKTIEEKGKEIAESIKKLLQHKIELNAGMGDVTFSDQTLKYMNHQLDSIIHLYMSLFAGTYQHKTYTFTFTLNPSSWGKTYLFTLNKEKGLVLDTSAKGDIYYVNIQPTSSFPIKSNEHQYTKKLPGIPYVIPQTIELSLFKNDTLFFSTNTLSPQDGKIAYLPYSVKQALFHPIFGYPMKVSFRTRFESSPNSLPFHEENGQH
jgi:hypothetical protein